jgi:small subunit ribosomal protein S8
MSNVVDPIADTLTRIRNAGQAGLETIVMPHSRMREEIAGILKREGFIADCAPDKAGTNRKLTLRLKYGQDRKPLIRGLRRISKSGLRRYVAAQDIPRVLDGMGIAILSTSRGLLTDREARQNKVGGEVLCYVW